MRVRAGLRRLRASMSVPGTAWASVTTTIRLGEWKPWRLYGELVENPDGEGLVVDLVPGGPEDAAPQAVCGVGVGRPDLPPEDVVDLARGGAGDYGLGGGA